MAEGEKPQQARQLHVILQADGTLSYQTANGTSYTDIILMCAMVQQYAFYDMQIAALKAKQRPAEDAARKEGD